MIFFFKCRTFAMSRAEHNDQWIFLYNAIPTNLRQINTFPLYHN
jgi:hypothetical protein